MRKKTLKKQKKLHDKFDAEYGDFSSRVCC